MEGTIAITFALAAGIVSTLIVQPDAAYAGPGCANLNW
jgi:hypothetical protein